MKIAKIVKKCLNIFYLSRSHKIQNNGKKKRNRTIVAEIKPKNTAQMLRFRAIFDWLNEASYLPFELRCLTLNETSNAMAPMKTQYTVVNIDHIR